MHQHTWGVTQIMLCFQSGCCFPGATTDLQHVRGQHSAHPPPCASHWYGVGRAPLFRAHVRAEVSKVWFMLRSVLGSQPSLCMHKVLVPLNVFTLQMKKATELININIMCIALATWHLIQKLKINYVNHPRWEALQEIDLLLLLPEEQIIWNQDKSKQPEVKQYKTKAPFPRQVSADFQVLCAGSETVASYENGLPGLSLVVCKNSIDSLTLLLGSVFTTRFFWMVCLFYSFSPTSWI